MRWERRMRINWYMVLTLMLLTLSSVSVIVSCVAIINKVVR